MIGHDREGVEEIVLQSRRVVFDGFHDLVRDSRLAQVERPRSGAIQQTVQHAKRLPGSEGTCGKGALGREAVVQAPGHKGWLPGLVDVRKMPAVEGHVRKSAGWRENLKEKEPTGGSAADQGVRPTKRREAKLL